MKVQFSKSTRRKIEMRLIRDSGNSFSADYTAEELKEIRDAIDKYLNWFASRYNANQTKV